MKRLIIVLLTLTCSYAFAEWELIDNNVQGYFFVDRSSLRKTGSTTKIWTKVDLIAPETLSNGKQFMSAKTFFVFECIDETFDILYAVYYSKSYEGSVVQSGEFPKPKMRPITPGSLDSMIWKIACNK